MAIKKQYTFFICIIVSVVVVYLSMYILNNLKKEFVSSFEVNELLINSELSKINDLLETSGHISKKILNKENLSNDFNYSNQSGLIDYFSYDEKRDFFHFDKALDFGENVKRINSITGKGNVDFLKDNNSIKTKEIYFSMLINDIFYMLNDKIDGSHWVYYTSLNEILTIRRSDLDFVTSDDFYYIDALQDMTFVTEGAKDKLKNREKIFWTHPYIDLGGAGLMVTASYPIDYKDEYVGSISVDFMSSTLNKLLEGKYSRFILNEDGVVISSNVDTVDLSNTLTNFNDLDINLTFHNLKMLEHGKVYSINGTKIISHAIKETPYVMYQIYKSNHYLKDVLISLFPLLLFIMLFIMMNLAFIKVHNSESKLKDILNILKENQRELDYIANFDPLTDVFNRRGFYSELKKSYNDNSIFGSSLVIVDIDHFKGVNDTYGHDVGDEILIELCVVINQCIRNSDMVARFGGEEFVVVLKNTDIKRACVLADRIRNTVREHVFKDVGRLTISCGVAEFCKELSQEQCFKYADNALYHAKRTGRDKVCYFDKESNTFKSSVCHLNS